MRAMREAARLKEQNESLQAELDERRRREEQLVQEQKKLQQQQRMLQQQRTKELQLQNVKLIEQERQLQRVEQEKMELERQRAKEAAPDPPPASRARSAAAAGARARAGTTDGLLPRGIRCRYESGTYGWMAAVVQGYNEADGTYNLDVRQHAALDKISPTAEVGAAEAWPPGTLAAYHSASVNQWLPAVVTSFNETDGTYNLDVRDHADLDRIRARVSDRPLGGEGEDPQMARRGSPSGSGGHYLTEMADGARANPRRHQTADLNNRTQQQGRDGSSRAPLRVGDLEATAGGAALTTGSGGSGGARRVGTGDRVALAEGGLAVVEAVHEGVYTVRTADRQRQKLQAEALRAPGEVKFAWPPGTKVSYQSASLKGRWIDANVVSFNAGNGTYNLDVRMEAAADKVRPR